MKPLFERVVIAGVGLIGGSLALAGKKAGIFKTVVGLGRGKANLDKALTLGVVDEVTTNLSLAVAGSDLFFAAVPVESVIDVCLKAADGMKTGGIITDGGSVKKEIVEQLSKRLPSSVRFVGGHPVAGSEKSGSGSANAALYKNRYTILTPTDHTDPQAVDLVRDMWKAVGSEVVAMGPDEHDKTMAMISHLPHFAAYALVDATVKADSAGSMRRFVAGGFRDTTRIAGSDPEMWRDIFSMNKERLMESINLFEGSLSELKEMVEQDNFDGLKARLEEIRSTRLKMDDHCE
ncbi:hypothetical protein MNBD_NITROSPINAE04-1993 [hydrothermal vent metagenome]|uniref:Prephenate/arogenate dehydrogenase domain-containing protein n=1 Tax=hydrothermal vent metagenome TaxID=652676 RepID=A0A3B1BWB2_9ZZZZ